MPDPNIIDEVLGGEFMSGEIAQPNIIVTRNEADKPLGFAGLDENGELNPSVLGDEAEFSIIESLKDTSENI